MKRPGEINYCMHHPMRAPALALLAGHRMVIAPLMMALFGPACRFEPSCSRYASAAISEHGLIRGGAMAIRRLLRCHPLGGHGYDPVPAASARPAGLD